MRVRSIGANQTQVTLANGTIIFFSYETPVAALTACGYIRTTKFWTPTTSRHIDKWIGGADAKEVDQTVLDSLA